MERVSGFRLGLGRSPRMWGLCILAWQIACHAPPEDENVPSSAPATNDTSEAPMGAESADAAAAPPVVVTAEATLVSAKLAQQDPIRPTDDASDAKLQAVAAPFELADIELPAEPVAALRELLALRPQKSRDRHCVQIRSLQALSVASRLASEIETQLSLPTWIFTADLGAKGTWYRLCVGAERTRRDAAKKAKLWTSGSGLLHPYMDPVKEGDAAYLLKERPAPQENEVTRAQAEVLLRAGASADDEIYFLLGADGTRYAAMTAPRHPDHPAKTDVLLVSPAGVLLPVAGLPEAPCATCESVWMDADATRRIQQVGTVDDVAGQVLLIAESNGEQKEGKEIVSILVPEAERLTRHASFLLSTRRPELHVLGKAEWLQADVDEEMELGLLRFELSLVENRLCAVRISSEIFDFSDGIPSKRDENHIALLANSKDGDDANVALRLIEGFDLLGDVDTSSRLCAAYLANGRSPKVARHCLRRVQNLGQRSVLLATKAAGFLAEASSLYRAAVANTLYRNALKLDRDKTLRVEAKNCVENPLVEDVTDKPDEELIRLAETKAASELNLAELPDAVFVTGLRDFGPETPFGALTTTWLAKIQDVLPARYAAIQAALLPPRFGENEDTPSPEPDAVAAPDETLLAPRGNTDVASQGATEVAP